MWCSVVVSKVKSRSGFEEQSRPRTLYKPSFLFKHKPLIFHLTKKRRSTEFDRRGEMEYGRNTAIGLFFVSFGLLLSTVQYIVQGQCCTLEGEECRALYTLWDYFYISIP